MVPFCGRKTNKIGNSHVAEVRPGKILVNLRPQLSSGTYKIIYL